MYFLSKLKYDIIVRLESVDFLEFLKIYLHTYDNLIRGKCSALYVKAWIFELGLSSWNSDSLLIHHLHILCLVKFLHVQIIHLYVLVFITDALCTCLSSIFLGCHGNNEGRPFIRNTTENKKCERDVTENFISNMLNNRNI